MHRPRPSALVPPRVPRERGDHELAEDLGDNRSCGLPVPLESCDPEEGFCVYGEIAIGHAMVRGVNTRYTEESQEEEEGCVEKENLCVSTHQRA